MSDHDPRRQRMTTLVVIAAAAAVGIVLVALGGGDDSSPRAASATTRPAATTRVTATTRVPATTRAAATTTTTTTTVPATTTTTIDPGSLPQTDEKPTGSGAQFDAGVQGLWQAIVRDDPALAKPFFYPLGAYVQIKDAHDPVGDFDSRLMPYFEQDIHKWHAQLGADASRAQLTGLRVAPDRVQWITPGTEFNKGSYWRALDSSLEYTVDGQPRSLTVKSMLSWRGQWYVIHLDSIR